MGYAAAFLLALIKGLPAAESLLTQLLSLYVAWKTEQNIADEHAKNARNALLVARASVGVRDLCETCPARNAGGQHLEAK
jgi:predicted transport protein